MHLRLARLLACEKYGSVPRALQEREPGSIFVGVATKEQRALALLWNQVEVEHQRMHRMFKMPYGVNPYVPDDHFRNHVMIPVLQEMLMWAIHRANPDKDMELETLSFDADWNIFAVPKALQRMKRKRE